MRRYFFSTHAGHAHACFSWLKLATSLSASRFSRLPITLKRFLPTIPESISRRNPDIKQLQHNPTTPHDSPARQLPHLPDPIDPERYALFELSTPIGIWDWDLQTNNIYFSPRAKSLLGYPESEQLHFPSAWFDRLDNHTAQQFHTDLAGHLAGRTPQLHNQHRIQRPDGDHAWLLCRAVSIRNPQGAAIRLIGSLTDVTAFKLAQDQLHRRALTDELTGLPNRAAFRQRAKQILDHARVNPHAKYALLFLDFDRFKLINDTLGHNAGDSLLISIARRIESALSTFTKTKHPPPWSHALPARVGGDEFVILLQGLRKINDAITLADSLTAEFAKPHVIFNQNIIATASIGVTTSDFRYRSVDALLADADAAMYHAKAAGKARHALFSPAMRPGPTYAQIIKS